MSYDFALLDPETGRICQFAENHGMVGGTYAIGGTDEATLNVTYNYGKYYYRVLGEHGLRGIHGKTGAESVPWLSAGIGRLGDDVTGNYWDGTEGNAREALKNLLAMAVAFPHGIWECDECQPIVRPRLDRKRFDDWCRKHTPTVRERLWRLNPKGCEPGSRPRGWNPKNTGWKFCGDFVTPSDILKREGREFYRSIPKQAWLHRGHQKYMTRMALLDRAWLHRDR